ncbi:MAG: DUF2807 domain-containing protein [Eudoraea sp.]|nr:DUF2807 domain-containing protein [Eudoraea sp.]
MKKTLIFLFAIGLCSISYAQNKPKIKGNKEVTQVSRQILEDFNALEIDDGLKINISQGVENSYVLNTDSNLVDVLQFFVVDSILKVYTTNKIVSSKKLEITMSVKGLEHLILKNDADITGEGPFNSSRFYISGYNSSRMDLDIRAEDVTVALHRNAGGKLRITSENTTIVMNDRTDLKAYSVCDNIRVTVNNSADLDLDGDAEYAAFNLKKSSRLNARNMKVRSADLYTSNSADVYVNATKNLEVYAQGSSNVYVYGNPKLEIKGFTDRSKIIKR